jgi:hypothetical protein
VQEDDCLPISDIFWTAHKWVCRRKDLPTTTPAESAPVFPLIDWQKYSASDIETALLFLIVKRLDEQKHSQAEIKTALALVIADRLDMPTTRVTRADVEAAIAEALEAKND